MSPENLREQVSVEQSINDLILLETVQEAHKEESEGWFNSLLVLFGSRPEPSETFFKTYETLYKEKSGQTKMPVTYRTAKSIITAGHSLGIDMWHNASLRYAPWGKTKIEKEIKRLRKEQSLTDEDRLMIVTKAVDKIRDTYLAMDPSSKACQEACDYIELNMPELGG